MEQCQTSQIRGVRSKKLVQFTIQKTEHHFCRFANQQIAEQLQITKVCHLQVKKTFRYRPPRSLNHSRLPPSSTTATHPPTSIFPPLAVLRQRRPRANRGTTPKRGTCTWRRPSPAPTQRLHPLPYRDPDVASTTTRRGRDYQSMEKHQNIVSKLLEVLKTKTLFCFMDDKLCSIRAQHYHTCRDDVVILDKKKALE